MAEVYVVYRIMPDGPDRDLSELKKNIESVLPSDARINAWEEEPIAFGLVALKVAIFIPEKEGYSDMIEEKLRSVPGVESIELIYFSRA